VRLLVRAEAKLDLTIRRLRPQRTVFLAYQAVCAVSTLARVKSPATDAYQRLRRAERMPR
jgi:hypothetical protein